MRPAPRLAAVVLGLAMAAVVACGPTLPGSQAPPPLPPGVRAHHAERTYPVRGTTRDEIRRSLMANRRQSVGGRFQGVHSWRMTWSYRYAPIGGACRMTSVEVRLVSETVLPRWEDRARADSTLAAEWDTYIGRLRTHENNHRAIAYRGAREVHRQLKRLTSPNCSTMSAWANQAAQGVLRRYNERNRAYDEETGHGRTEGVAWPVSPAAVAPVPPDARL